MPRKIIHAITEHTNQVWPADHPLRSKSVVMKEEDIPKDAILICSYAGDYRLPPAPGDFDVVGMCDCGKRIVWRASAPKLIKRVCKRCSERV